MTYEQAEQEQSFKEAAHITLIEGYEVDCGTYKKSFGDIVCDDLAYKEGFIESLRLLAANPSQDTANKLAELVNAQVSNVVDDLAIWMEKGQ